MLKTVKLDTERTYILTVTVLREFSWLLAESARWNYTGSQLSKEKSVVIFCVTNWLLIRSEKKRFRVLSLIVYFSGLKWPKQHMPRAQNAHAVG